MTHAKNELFDHVAVQPSPDLNKSWDFASNSCWILSELHQYVSLLNSLFFHGLLKLYLLRPIYSYASFNISSSIFRQTTSCCFLLVIVNKLWTYSGVFSLFLVTLPGCQQIRMPKKSSNDVPDELSNVAWFFPAIIIMLSAVIREGVVKTQAAPTLPPPDRFCTGDTFAR